MKLSSLVLLTLQITINTIAYDLDTVSQAFIDVIEKLFIKNQIHFDILIYGNLTRDSLDLINMIKLKNNENYTDQILKIKPNLWDHKINKSAVIFVKDVASLNYINTISRLDSPYPHHVSFLMYCEDVGNVDIDDILAPRTVPCFGMVPIFQYILINEITSLDLHTFEWYTKDRCNDADSEKINSFDMRFKIWDKELVIEEKFKQFHGCMLTIRLIAKYMMTDVNKFTSEPYGPLVDFFKAMAHVGNFTYNHQLEVSIYGPNIEPEMVAKDGMVFKFNAFFQMGDLMSYTLSSESIHFMTMFRELKVVCLLTPGEMYNSYEKLVFPFDFWTWILLFGVFGCTFVSIIVINKLPGTIQNTFFGENVITPAQNVVAIFFGISQTQIPFWNFPRIILIAFVLFCLVLRTAYQSVLFELIAADIRKPLPKSFHDLYLNNFSIYTVDMLEDMFKELLPKEVV